MSEVTTITCDKCHERVVKASRTRITWSRQPERREPWDLCPSCRDELLEHFGILPPTLPGLFDGPGPNDPSEAEIQAAASGIKAAKLAGAAKTRG